MKKRKLKDGMLYNIYFQVNKINLNTFEDYELDLYDDYCQFVKRKFLDEVLNLDDSYLDRIMIDDISSSVIPSEDGRKKISGNIKALILFQPDCNGVNTQTYIFETIGFLKWITILRRDKKLNDLGI